MAARMPLPHPPSPIPHAQLTATRGGTYSARGTSDGEAWSWNVWVIFVCQVDALLYFIIVNFAQQLLGRPCQH